ncbi:CPBP family intramembrane glutamic endopeptidase [Mucilaginibacter terrae]|uniref:Membrane protease YdiL (CAAX protease family) n=1 Tax=Mucilaginibacter terrae TaxID=1955052 RepID=A0ABU3GSU7_9SPHI|nr:CPBP family glutamic-type intramembrane protease [Mucilaginibacter terrae]MDT3402700.1 membrane protease YdiL (CAAX protease family) [Mucilaginibacter terrae]
MNLILPIINTLLHLAILLTIALAIRRKYSWSDYQLFLWFALIHIAESVIVSTVKFDVFPGEQWNWSGKIAVLVAALVCLYNNNKISLPEAGWTFKLKPGSLWPVVGVMVVFLGLRLFLKLSSGASTAFHAETFAFQAILPGLTEELIYRGVLLGFLNKIYKPSITIIKAPIGWGVLITSLLFGLVHGVNLDEHFHLTINSQKLFMTFGLGLILAWLKQRTDSIVPSIIFHNLWNLIVFV